MVQAFSLEKCKDDLFLKDIHILIDDIHHLEKKLLSCEAAFLSNPLKLYFI
jgi:hypothetical protein